MYRHLFDFFRYLSQKTNTSLTVVFNFQGCFVEKETQPITIPEADRDWPIRKEMNERAEKESPSICTKKDPWF